MSEPDEGTARLSAITSRHYPPTGRPRERKPIPGGVFSKIEPLRLDGSMTKGDLIWSLEHLSFGRSSVDPRQRATVSLDRAVRDYLLAALKR
jgi:hypothetical protein